MLFRVEVISNLCVKIKTTRMLNENWTKEVRSIIGDSSKAQ